MSETFRCEDKETLVAYLYGDISPDQVREVERHLRTCEPCTEEIGALQMVRQDLESWVPPVPDLNFSIIRQPAAAPQPAAVLRPQRWSTFRTVPVWAQAVAAMLVVGVSAAIANVQVRYSADGLMVTTGWMSPAAPAAAATREPAASKEEWRPALVSLEQSLRTELAQMKRTGDTTAIASRTSDAADTAAVLRRVQTMLDASEQRQREQTRLMLTQLSRDVDMQRRADLMRINQGFGTLQGRTFKNEAGQAEMMNLLRRVSVQPVP
jgi:hypothetical protein